MRRRFAGPAFQTHESARFKPDLCCAHRYDLYGTSAAGYCVTVNNEKIIIIKNIKQKCGGKKKVQSGGGCRFTSTCNISRARHDAAGRFIKHAPVIFVLVVGGRISRLIFYLYRETIRICMRRIIIYNTLIINTKNTNNYANLVYPKTIKTPDNNKCAGLIVSTFFFLQLRCRSIR